METTIRELPCCEHLTGHGNETCEKDPRYVVTFADGSEMYLCFYHATPYVYRDADLTGLEALKGAQ